MISPGHLLAQAAAMARPHPRRSGRSAFAAIAIGSLLVALSLPVRAQTPDPPPAPNRQLAYPPGTTAGLVELALVLFGGLLLLFLFDRVLNRRADRAGEASLAQEARSLRQLRIGYPEGMTFLEELRAQRLLEQRFGPLGLTVSWFPYPSASSLLSDLASGRIDFCGGGGTASLFSQAAGHLFVRVAREKYPDLQGEAILVPEGSPIRSLPDLRGRRVAFDEGSSAHYVLIRALQIVGLDYDDVEPVLLPQSEALPLFERGELDAWVVWMPYAPTGFRRRYPGRSIADLNGILGDAAGQEVPTLYYATPELVRDNPRVLKAILEEVNEAGVAYNVRQLERAESLGVGGDEEGIDPETMVALRQRVLERAILPIDEPTLRSLQHQVQVLHDRKLIPTRINVFDGSFSLRTRQNWTY